MIPVQSLDPHAFVAHVRPLLEAKDLKALIAAVRGSYTADQILELLTGKCQDASKVAALTLSWIGCRECIPKLAERLQDPDTTVNQMVEHALWAIWFRLGNQQSNVAVCRGTQAINRQDFHTAIDYFTSAIEISPAFAEAYNQRAIAYYLIENYERCIADCQRALELMPCHFGACAGLGHCYAHLEQFNEALQWYRKAVVINPHLTQIHESIAELQARWPGL